MQRSQRHIDRTIGMLNVGAGIVSCQCRAMGVFECSVLPSMMAQDPVQPTATILMSTVPVRRQIAAASITIGTNRALEKYRILGGGFPPRRMVTLSRFKEFALAQTKFGLFGRLPPHTTALKAHPKGVLESMAVAVADAARDDLVSASSRVDVVVFVISPEWRTLVSVPGRSATASLLVSYHRRLLGERYYYDNKLPYLYLPAATCEFVEQVPRDGNVELLQMAEEETGDGAKAAQAKGERRSMSGVGFAIPRPDGVLVAQYTVHPRRRGWQVSMQSCIHSRAASSTERRHEKQARGADEVCLAVQIARYRLNRAGPRNGATPVVRDTARRRLAGRAGGKFMDGRLMFDAEAPLLVPGKCVCYVILTGSYGVFVLQQPSIANATRNTDTPAVRRTRQRSAVAGIILALCFCWALQLHYSTIAAAGAKGTPAALGPRQPPTGDQNRRDQNYCRSILTSWDGKLGAKERDWNRSSSSAVDVWLRLAVRTQRPASLGQAAELSHGVDAYYGKWLRIPRRDHARWVIAAVAWCLLAALTAKTLSKQAETVRFRDSRSHEAVDGVAVGWTDEPRPYYIVHALKLRIVVEYSPDDRGAD
ncbi:hypothetical protein CMUS01_13411 [Colletotrichum musicola]|uniref:Uncharacterized protein n=1 Tax=Colletotrichum musicola TaxID=2175873 RepID=A0A8H6MWC5_9PEZI|nr:hypothetical protein CMUS01_13411 [Colletotrichum musicola]